MSVQRFEDVGLLLLQFLHRQQQVPLLPPFKQGLAPAHEQAVAQASHDDVDRAADVEVQEAQVDQEEGDLQHDRPLHPLVDSRTSVE